MRTHVYLPNAANYGKTDVEILKAYTKTVIGESGKLIYASYDEEPIDDDHWYDNKHLGRLEIILDEICDILADSDQDGYYASIFVEYIKNSKRTEWR